MRRSYLLCRGRGLAWLLAAAVGACQSPAPPQSAARPPVIDMHLHALAADEQGPPPLRMALPFSTWGAPDPRTPYPDAFMQAMKTGSWARQSTRSPTTDDSLRLLTLQALTDNNVYAVTSGDVARVRHWHRQAPARIIPAVYWDMGLARTKGLSVDSLRRLFRGGEFRVFGEVGLQYEGISPSDPAFEPYLALAEELDVPVGIHVGPGPPGVVQLGATHYRAALHSALVLEEALVRHPRLRVYAMHAGWPMLDDMLATLYAHPQLYVDLGVIGYILPEAEYYRYLQRLVEAGFGQRVMFGSDNMVWPGTIAFAIDRINRAPFLSEQQKRDILFNNAARFLRLTDAQIRQMQAGSAATR